MKYKILKALDVMGLKVLEPVVRLAYGEEPREQLRQVVLFLLIPAMTFALFIGLWTYIAPRHKTKSGEVPTPSVVLDAYGGIVTFHNREYTKLADFARSGTDRETQLASVRERLEQVKEESQEMTAQFKELEEKREQLLTVKIAPYSSAIEKQEYAYRLDQEKRRQGLMQKAAEIQPGDQAGREEYKELVRRNIEQTASERDHLKSLRSELDELRSEKWTPLEVARAKKNGIDQEQQFLSKRLAYLTTDNRANKVSLASGKISDLEEQYAAAQGDDLYALATQIVKGQDRIRKVQDSSYAKPPTFFDQIVTSVKCVFTGFVIATVVAIPLGILCGLSRVFMASITPLISLFKPVSPIVWLPIVFIIVGGFIDVPEEAWVAPAFLSSAITVALCSLWPTLVNTALGVASIDQDHLNVARVLRLGFWSRLFKIVIPSSLPLIFAGLRISLGVGWMVLIAGELLSSSPGLGKFVWDMFNNGSSETFAQMFVVVFFVGAIGLLLDRMMIVLQRAVSFDGAPTAI